MSDETIEQTETDDLVSEIDNELSEKARQVDAEDDEAISVLIEQVATADKEASDIHQTPIAWNLEDGGFIINSDYTDSLKHGKLTENLVTMALNIPVRQALERGELGCEHDEFNHVYEGVQIDALGSILAAVSGIGSDEVIEQVRERAEAGLPRHTRAVQVDDDSDQVVVEENGTDAVSEDVFYDDLTELFEALIESVDALSGKAFGDPAQVLYRDNEEALRETINDLRS